jgi:hypothetical protein
MMIWIHLYILGLGAANGYLECNVVMLSHKNIDYEFILDDFEIFIMDSKKKKVHHKKHPSYWIR